MRTEQVFTGRFRGSPQRGAVAASLMLVVALGLLIALGAATQARAADTCISQRGNVACVRQTNTRVDACDHLSNNRRVRAHFITALNRNAYYVGKWDANGAAPGCSQTRAPAYVLYYQVCEEGTGCSAWHRTG